MEGRRVTVPRVVLDCKDMLNDDRIRDLLTGRPVVDRRSQVYEPCDINFEVMTTYDYDKALPVIGKFAWRSAVDQRFAGNAYEGPYYYKNEQAVFAGQMKAGMREGRGFMAYADGNLYEGYFERDTTNICGRLVFDNGDVFEGDISEMSMNGQGIYYNNSVGSKYTGQFKDDMPHGHGKEEWTDGTFYEGGFAAGAKHGKGVFKTKEGSIYEGEFKQGAFNGKGTFTTTSKTKIRGTWKSAELQSPAEITYEDGKTYKGDVNKDMKPHGNGIIVGPKKRYSGTFRNGSLDGEVVTTYPGGEIKRSVYKEGVFVKWIEAEDSEKSVKLDRDSQPKKTKNKPSGGSPIQSNNGTMINPPTPQPLQTAKTGQQSSIDTSNKQSNEKKAGCLCC